MSTRRAAREAKRRRSRKIRALLAAGVVFGVGAGATLAAWNDSEYATATFTAGQFGIVGSINGTSFSEHSSEAGAASLAFTMPAATAMAPGTTVYALFSVRTTNPSIAGTVQLAANSGNNAGLGEHLRYGVRTIAGTTCNQTAYNTGTVVIAADSTLTTGAEGAQALAANGTTQINYCFAVTLPANAPNGAQGKTLTAKWVFEGVSS